MHGVLCSLPLRMVCLVPPPLCMPCLVFPLVYGVPGSVHIEIRNVVNIAMKTVGWGKLGFRLGMRLCSDVGLTPQ